MKIIILIFTAFVLASCNSGKGYGSYESPVWHKTASSAEKMKYFKQQCVSFGFKENTSEMAKCIQDQTNASVAGARKIMSDTSRNLNRNIRASNRSIDCTTNYMGSSAYTSCY